MFLHSGASLHGHEYSARSSSGTPPTASAAAAAHRRNPSLLRSALYRASTPPASSYLAESPSSSPSPRSPSTSLPTYFLLPQRPRVSSDPAPATARAASPSKAAEHDLPSPQQSRAMTEDDVEQCDTDGCVSDSDVSRVARSNRRSRRLSVRKSTTYLLAQPAPKLRHKQRLIHTKPPLLTQLQLLTPGDRPRPVIDAYPSSAFAKTILAPILKRVPRIAGIKTELSVTDVMLVKSQDYAADANDTDSDVDDDNMKSRDLVAILSPLKFAGHAEIVMADGTIWTASPRINGRGCSFDLVSIDANGAVLTARWVRRHSVSKPTSPATTPSLSGFPTTPPPPEYKYTFSIIKSDCRRHPILATLSSTNLEIFDSYTTVSQPSSRCNPTSPLASPAASISSDQDRKSSRDVLPVEQWQKDLIAISAIWVASRAGWTANSKSVDPLPSPSANTAIVPSTASAPSNRVPNRVSSPVLGVKKAHTTTGSEMLPQDRSLSASHSRLGVLPRRAMSSGAAFMQRRRAALIRADSTSYKDAGTPCVEKRHRRALSGNWVGKMATGLGQTSLTAVALTEVEDIPEETKDATPKPPSLAPSPLPGTVTATLPATKPETRELWQRATTVTTITGGNPQEKGQERAEGLDGTDKHGKWRSMASWVTKLRSR